MQIKLILQWKYLVMEIYLQMKNWISNKKSYDCLSKGCESHEQLSTQFLARKVSLSSQKFWLSRLYIDAFMETNFSSRSSWQLLSIRNTWYFLIKCNVFFKDEYQFNVQLFSSWVAFKTIRSHSNQVEFVTYCVVWVWSKLEGFLICDFDLYCSLCLSLDECSWALLEDFLYILT